LSRTSPHKKFSIQTKTKLAKYKRVAEKRTALFTIKEINYAIAKIKTRKLASG